LTLLSNISNNKLKPSATADVSDKKKEMNLRKELVPPKFDESKVKKLANLAEKLDGCNSLLENCESLRSEFNLLANSDLQIEDFHFSGGIDANTFVKKILAPKPQKIENISYDEMLELITRICNADGTEYEIEYWLEFLEVQIENNRLSDLIYHPNHYFDDNLDRTEMTEKEILDEALKTKNKIFYLS
jgi:hypothetical protein